MDCGSDASVTTLTMATRANPSKKVFADRAPPCWQYLQLGNFRDKKPASVLLLFIILQVRQTWNIAALFPKLGSKQDFTLLYSWVRFVFTQTFKIETLLCRFHTVISFIFVPNSKTADSTWKVKSDRFSCGRIHCCGSEMKTEDRLSGQRNSTENWYFAVLIVWNPSYSYRGARKKYPHVWYQAAPPPFVKVKTCTGFRVLPWSFHVNSTAMWTVLLF